MPTAVQAAGFDGFHSGKKQVFCRVNRALSLALTGYRAAKHTGNPPVPGDPLPRLNRRAGIQQNIVSQPV
jgi:hypothetical protein